MVKINEKEKKVLRCLVEEYDCYGELGYGLFFRGIAPKTKLKIKEVRRACRSLAKKGLAELNRGLVDDDGILAGSGYGATREGVNLFTKPLI